MKYSIAHHWITDCKNCDTGFPDIDPSNMTGEERDILASYLRFDDGSLSDRDMKFSRHVADIVDALEPEDPEEPEEPFVWNYSYGRE